MVKSQLSFRWEIRFLGNADSDRLRDKLSFENAISRHIYNLCALAIYI
jgi:hypothetical protein